MEKEFIPYDRALKLKELGFDEECFKYYTSAPLWQQAFNWFREKHGLNSSICPSTDNRDYYFFIHNDIEVNKRIPITFKGRNLFVNYSSYQEAQLACLDTLIEILEQQNK